MNLVRQAVRAAVFQARGDAQAALPIVEGRLRLAVREGSAARIMSELVPYIHDLPPSLAELIDPILEGSPSNGDIDRVLDELHDAREFPDLAVRLRAEKAEALEAVVLSLVDAEVEAWRRAHVGAEGGA